MNDFLSSFNHTNIVLISKKDYSESVRNLRLISLYNILYKIYSKALVNRLKWLFSGIIVEEQSTFMLERCITNNILVAFETIHKMKHLCIQRGYEMAIKVDISKANDSVKWEFLEAMLLKFGFHTRWVQLIMRCAQSFVYMVKLNDHEIGPVIPY